MAASFCGHSCGVLLGLLVLLVLLVGTSSSSSVRAIAWAFSGAISWCAFALDFGVLTCDSAGSCSIVYLCCQTVFARILLENFLLHSKHALSGALQCLMRLDRLTLSGVHIDWPNTLASWRLVRLAGRVTKAFDQRFHWNHFAHRKSLFQ